MKISEITAQAVDKWDLIFHSLGIEVGNGKHCPCQIDSEQLHNNNIPENPVCKKSNIYSLKQHYDNLSTSPRKD